VSRSSTKSAEDAASTRAEARTSRSRRNATTSPANASARASAAAHRPSAASRSRVTIPLALAQRAGLALRLLLGLVHAGQVLPRRREVALDAPVGPRQLVVFQCQSGRVALDVAEARGLAP